MLLDLSGVSVWIEVCDCVCERELLVDAVFFDSEFVNVEDVENELVLENDNENELE